MGLEQSERRALAPQMRTCHIGGMEITACEFGSVRFGGQPHTSSERSPRADHRRSERGEAKMLNATRVRSLSQLPQPLLTAYLDTNPAKPSNRGLVRAYLTWLKKEANSIAQSVPPAEQELFREQLRRTEEFLRDRTPQERGIVIFAGSAIWEVVSLQLEVENELRWGKPAVSQLLWLVDEHRPYCIVVVDRAGARFFRYQLGEMIELEEKKFRIDISQWKKKDLGHVAHPRIRKTRGSQRDTFEHRIDARYARLCAETAELATRLCEKQGLTALFLVGSDRLIEPIEAEFPREFRRRVVLIPEGLARMSSPQLEQRLEAKIADWEREHESTLVIALLGNDHGAVVGIDETLAQLQKGKIRSLLLVRDLDASLRQCVKCGWTDRSADPVCSVCGGERRAVTLRDVLPELAWSSKASVEVVSGEAAKRLKEAGGMGAWLCQPKQAGLSRAAKQAD